jgi:hypothetical protein
LRKLSSAGLLISITTRRSTIDALDKLSLIIFMTVIIGSSNLRNNFPLFRSRRKNTFDNVQQELILVVGYSRLSFWYARYLIKTDNFILKVFEYLKLSGNFEFIIWAIYCTCPKIIIASSYVFSGFKVELMKLISSTGKDYI